MAKLSFLDENDSEEETQQSFVPRLNRFKTRKRDFKNLSSKNDTTSKSRNNKTYLSFDEDEDTVDDIKNHLTSPMYKPKGSVNNLGNDINNDTLAPDTKTGKNIQDYLNSYGNTSFVINKELPKGISRNKTEEDTNENELMPNKSSYNDSNKEIEGFIIEGSDLEDDSSTEQSKNDIHIIKTTKNMNNHHVENDECLNELNTQKLNAKRRREIEDALMSTNLNDLSNYEESDDEQTVPLTRKDDHDKNNTYVVNFDSYNNDNIDKSDLSIKEIKHKLKSSRDESEVRFVCYNINPLLDQLNTTDEKLKTIHNIIKKREIQMNHLESEYEKIECKKKEYIEKLKYSFHSLQ